MSWKRYFRAVNTAPTLNVNQNSGEGGGTSSKQGSFLPEVYAGHPNRIQRYYQYDDMDRDSDINAALDTIADFCTQSEEQNKEPFEIYYTGEPNETEVTLLKNSLVKWTKLNNFRSKLWHMFRNTIKNGDAFFLRDPENGEWLWIDHFAVEMVKVDDTAGKDPDEYLIRGLDINKTDKFATKDVDASQYRTPLGSTNIAGVRPASNQTGGAFSLVGTGMDSRNKNLTIQNQLSVVSAENVIHLSLSVQMDVNWPFGASILEPIFKTYKQKELLEDSVIIYRVQRAPERRIFYIDTGSMPPIRAKAYIEQIKNEIHQKKIPSRGGGGGSMIDSAYSPLCLAMDTKVPLLDGRTLTIAEISAEYKAGKTNWAYSCDPITGEVMPGIITWAGVTRASAKTIKITLDNGEILICTPDHKIPVLGKGFTEAENLTVDDSLIAYGSTETKIRHLSKIETFEEMEVGTITIDKEEKYHAHHTFAIASGIFVKNSMLDDYYFSQSADGRGSKVETLPGGEMTGEIGDLLFFSKKLARGLRIPTSYLSLGGDEEGGGASYNDGKLGAALIQEFRFNKYCMRLQALLAPKFDKDFKWFLAQSGVIIDPELFELQFMPPQNFTKYRQIELDAQQVNVYSQISENKRLSERFKLKRFLNLSDEELLDNEKLWAEENPTKVKKASGVTPAEQPTQDLSSVGLRGSTFSDEQPFGDAPMDDQPADQETPPAEPAGGQPPAPDAGPPPSAPAPQA